MSTACSRVTSGPANLGLFEYLPRSISRSYSDDDFRSNVLDEIPENFVERSIEELPVSASIRLLNDELVHDVLGTLVRRSILRGPDVYVLEDHRLPLVSFGIFFPGGRLLESASNAGITELMLRTSLKGTRRYNSSDIARRLENAGARIEVVNEPDFFGYLLDGVSGQMDEALRVLMEVVQEPTFSELVVESEQRLQHARIRRLRQDGFEYPVQLALGALFEGNAYGQSRYGAESSLDSITRDDLIAWHRGNQRTLVPVIVIVGDIRGTGLVASIAETLTNEDLFERDIATLPAPQIDTEPAETVETLARRQTAVVYGFPRTRVRWPGPHPYNPPPKRHVRSGGTIRRCDSRTAGVCPFGGCSRPRSGQIGSVSGVRGGFARQRRARSGVH